MSDTPMLSAKELLERIDRILNDTAYLKDAFTTIEKIPQEGDNTESARLKADAVARIVQSREKTNRQALRLLEALAFEDEDEEASEEDETEE